MSNIGGLDEEKEAQEETTEIINLNEEKKKRKLFHYWKVGDREYKLKLRAANVERLENKYKCNIMNLVEEMPPLSTMLTIIQAAMLEWEHGIKYEQIKRLYDQYTDEGGNQISLYRDIILPTLAVSGFFTEDATAQILEASEI